MPPPSAMHRAAILVLVLVVGAPARARAAERDEATYRPYGGLALAATLAPTGSGNELERGCQDLGAATCETPIPVGLALLPYVGIARRPFGVELLVGMMGDLHRPSARFDGQTHVPHGNPLVATPPRDETFILLRGAGLFALRARYTREPEGTWHRETIAAGLGLAYRYAALEREVTTDAGLEDRPYFPSGSGYVAPALTLDAAFEVRATDTLAVAFGLFTWLESAGDGVRSAADPARRLAGEGGLSPLATPEYRMTSGVQWLVCPYVGMHFGP